MQRTAKYYWLTVIAYSCLVIGMTTIFLFSGIIANSTLGMIAGMCVCGFSNGIGVTTSLIALIANSSHEDQAVATACSYLFRSLGSVFGVSLSATVANATLRSSLADALGSGTAAADIAARVRESLGYIGTLEPAVRDLYVNHFIGTQGSTPGTSYNGGNVFPGPTWPFGAVKVGIDTTVFNLSIDANAGYTPDGNVTAITLLHESGTGGAPKYGVIPQMPLTTLEGVNVLDNLTYMQPRTGADVASVGYYKTSLANGVVAEMAASQHAGLMQYSFPASGGKYVLVDLSHYLPTQDDHVPEQYYSNGMIEASNDGSMYGGYGVYRGGWNEAPDYTVYFCGKFDTPPENTQLFSGAYTDPYWPNGTVPGSSPQPTASFTNATSINGGTPGYQYADRTGALFRFPANASTVRSKVGVSWISYDKACQFVNEIQDFDLNATVAATKNAWSTEVFSKTTTMDTSNATRLEMMYSALYRMHLLPSDRTGENPNWRTEGPYYDDFYTLWDTFRCLNSFLNLVQPKVAEGIVITLIDIWKHERFMPDGRSSNYNGRVQGGSNADNVLADAYVKGIGGAINWTEGYMAMKTDAEVVPYNNFDPQDLTQSTKEGRGALPDWLTHGFVTPKYGRSISKTVEYSLNDFALYQVAKTEAPQDAATYLNRSAGWQRIWNHNLTSLNYTGFLTPVYPNGTIQSGYDPLSCGACEWDAIAYEALPWEYSWTVPFDMETLISFIGGPARTESRLDTMFIPNIKTTAVGTGGTNGIGSTLFNPGNEPSFSTPFLYNYLQGRQYKSVQRSRETVNQYYTTGLSGLPGNSDAGAIDSWLVWNMLGLYPVVTQPVYLLLSPFFSDITLSVAGNSTLRITAQGLGDESYYVQSVKVNGQQWYQSWVSHSDLTKEGGATIEFVLGPRTTSWDTGALPPSPGHLVL
ncbi:hypothetical protein B0A49_09728 [Cryomyces minteri]|uniref:Glycosyl hydrolase family 92 domain-containing protein n=1 Tax=Cryomyces minteri TaxID=331657 RepID=A0A4U0WGS8_9PEZI|nr:hypothetical protein B0A49_09728 [Cryomyces minteri]